MIGLAWPLAAGDAMGTLLVFAIVLLSAIARLINKAREAKQLADRNRPRDPAAPPRPQTPEKRDPLANEIEDFLKRAAQRRQSAAQRRASPPAEPVITLSPADVEAPTRRLVQTPTVDLGTQQSAQLIPLEGQPDSVAAHVQEQLSAAKITAATQGLGREVTDLDRGFEQHLHQTFDQRVGRLTGLGGESATPQGAIDLDASSQSITAAAESFRGLSALLANPGSLRQAVVFSEIFNRPESRWE
jgi:hypothetical protein